MSSVGDGACWRVIVRKRSCRFRLHRCFHVGRRAKLALLLWEFEEYDWGIGLLRRVEDACCCIGFVCNDFLF